MKKVFKLLAYIFVSSIIIFGAILIVYRQNIFEYLNSVNNLSRSNDSVLNDIKRGGDLAANPLNLAILNNPKFKKMQLTEVDLTGLNLSTTTPTDGITASTSESMPTFDVGNSNPFKAF